MMEHTGDVAGPPGRRIFWSGKPRFDIRKGENVMKKHGLRLLLTLCLATAFAVALGAVPAATESPPWYEMETAGDAYEFPITPEKTPEEWEHFIKEEMKEECGNRQPVRLKFGYSYLRKKNGSLLSFSDWKQQADDMLCSNK